MRAASPLRATLGLAPTAGVEKSLDTARKSACATSEWKDNFFAQSPDPREESVFVAARAQSRGLVRVGRGRIRKGKLNQVLHDHEILERREINTDTYDFRVSIRACIRDVER